MWCSCIRQEKPTSLKKTPPLALLKQIRPFSRIRLPKIFKLGHFFFKLIFNTAFEFLIWIYKQTIKNVALSDRFMQTSFIKLQRSRTLANRISGGFDKNGNDPSRFLFQKERERSTQWFLSAIKSIVFIQRLSFIQLLYIFLWKKNNLLKLPG